MKTIEEVKNYIEIRKKYLDELNIGSDNMRGRKQELASLLSFINEKDNK